MVWDFQATRMVDARSDALTIGVLRGALSAATATCNALCQNFGAALWDISSDRENGDERLTILLWPKGAACAPKGRVVV